MALLFSLCYSDARHPPLRFFPFSLFPQGTYNCGSFCTCATGWNYEPAIFDPVSSESSVWCPIEKHNMCGSTTT